MTQTPPISPLSPADARPVPSHSAVVLDFGVWCPAQALAAAQVLPGPSNTPCWAAGPWCCTPCRPWLRWSDWRVFRWWYRLGIRFLNPLSHLVVLLVFVAACGGATRAGSVLNGLSALLEQGAQAQDWVLVHDAARCLLTAADVDRLIDACQHDAVGGLLALKLPDTLKQEQGGRVAATVDRSDKWLAQTPQMFRIRCPANCLAGGR